MVVTALPTSTRVQLVRGAGQVGSSRRVSEERVSTDHAYRSATRHIALTCCHSYKTSARRPSPWPRGQPPGFSRKGDGAWNCCGRSDAPFSNMFFVIMMVYFRSYYPVALFVLDLQIAGEFEVYC